MPQRLRRRIRSDEEIYRPLRDPGVWKMTLLLGGLLAIVCVGGWLIVRGFV